MSKVTDTASFIFYVTKPRLSQARALSCPRFFVSLDIVLNVWQSYNLNTTIQAQGELFPSFLGEKIPQTHHVRLLSGIVDALDITDLLETYKSFGCPAYHPRMLLKVVFYAYRNNIYSCRKIEDALKYHVHYMWLSGSQTPSFSTINVTVPTNLSDHQRQLLEQARH